MGLGASVRVRAQKVMQHVQKRPHMSAVASLLAYADVVDDHVADAIFAVLLAGEIFSERSGGDFGDVLVLGDGEHFPFGQTAKGDAIFKSNHATKYFGRPRHPKRQRPRQRATRDHIRIITGGAGEI
jgi:hypothetical protein